MQITLALLGLGALASACTTVLVNTTSGVGVIGRTMELGSMDLPTDVTNRVDLATMDHSVETTPVPLYRGLDVRPFEFGAAAATAEL